MGFNKKVWKTRYCVLRKDGTLACYKTRWSKSAHDVIKLSQGAMVVLELGLESDELYLADEGCALPALGSPPLAS
jgi:hypothetical protein